MVKSMMSIIHRLTVHRLAEQSVDVLRHISLRGGVWPNACAAAIRDLCRHLNRPHRTQRQAGDPTHLQPIQSTVVHRPTEGRMSADYGLSTLASVAETHGQNGGSNVASGAAPTHRGRLPESWTLLAKLLLSSLRRKTTLLLLRSSGINRLLQRCLLCGPVLRWHTAATTLIYTPAFRIPSPPIHYRPTPSSTLTMSNFSRGLISHSGWMMINTCRSWALAGEIFQSKPSVFGLSMACARVRLLYTCRRKTLQCNSVHNERREQTESTRNAKAVLDQGRAGDTALKVLSELLLTELRG